MEFITVIISDLEKVGFGATLFLMAYISNVCLGAWRSVKIEGCDFDWQKIVHSAIKYVVLTLGIALLSVVVSALPTYIIYVGVDISDETMQVLDSIVIVSAFVVACGKYVKDAYDKLKEILGG